MSHLGNTNKMVGEDHIPDIGKMVSDTPRTDAAYFKPGSTMYDLAGEMKRMERELNAANTKIKRLEEFVDQLTNPKFTRDDLPKEALLQRIKRMEEAGDAMFIRSTRVGREIWTKAKEDKP